MKRTFLLLLGASMLLVDCNKDDLLGTTVEEYSSYPCYVVINNAYHLNAILSSVMNASTPGIFCELRSQTLKGAPGYHLLSNDGRKDSLTLTGDEQRNTRRVGRNNGIIVGYSNLGNGFYGFDRECPNCYNNGNSSYPLKMGTNGQASCQNCGRTYDLNNRGFIVTGDNGNPMTRYKASCTGPDGVLAVQNQ